MDAGIKLTHHGHSEYPEKVTNLSEIDGVLLSHAHLDHCGALPYLDHQGLNCPIYATGATKALTKLILEDAYKIGKLKHRQLGYFHEDIDKMLACVKKIKKKEWGTIKDIRFEFFNAGHIPGSASALVETEGKRIVYSADIKVDETALHRGMDMSYADEDIDALICEATYGDRTHPARKKVEQDFAKAINNTLNNGGSVIIPVFAMGRAQEVLLVVTEILKNRDVPVYLNGMAVTATEIALKFPPSVKDHAALSKAYAKAKPLKGWRARDQAAKEQGVFITTSGMITGGPVMHYLKLLNNSRNSILFTGYQGKHTNGRLLQERGIVYMKGWKTRIKCSWKKFDFSAHAGLGELKRYIKRVNPAKLIFNHGDPDAIKNITEWAEALDFKTYAPNLCDKVVV